MMMHKLVFSALFLASLCFSFSAVAAVGKIVSQSEAAESSEIKVTLNKKNKSGVASISGCEKCPLKLNIDNKTKYYYNGKIVPRKKIWRYTGKPGTVIYDNTEKRVIRVRWSS